MEEKTLFHYGSLLLLTILFTISILRLLKPKPRCNNHPPSPPALPIIGHLHLLGAPLHHALSRLSRRYGPVLLLRFGSRPVLVITSPSAVEECFTKNDITFANRPRLHRGKHLSYNYSALAVAPYGPLWRNLRRVATVEMFSPSRVHSLSFLRQEEVRVMLRELFVDGGDGFRKADMKTKLSELTVNIMMKIIAGKRYFGVSREGALEEGRRFQGMIEELFYVTNAASPEDFLPFMRWLGFNGLQKRLGRLVREMDEFFQELIEERRRERGKRLDSDTMREKEKRTVIDVLLCLQETDGEYYTDQLIKGMILTLIAAGIDTTSGTMEWAMSLLLNHPEALQKVREEIDNQVGLDRLVNDSDLQNLRYLNNVIKETLRLFPTVPLLLPHESSDHCTVGGFDIPRGTILFVNAYAIHRDPELWAEPAKFKPERFESEGMDGSKIYLPFGLGRRSCPGEGLAMRVVGLSLGALIQCFEWERIGEEEVDMSERPGITMPKAKPLEAMYKPRKVMVNVLCGL